MEVRMKTLTVIILAVLIGGCSLWQAGETHRQRLAVQYAVLKITEGQEARQQRVREVVDDLREGVEAAQKVTIADLANEVRAQVNWERLDLADQVLLREVLATAQNRLEAEFGTEPIIGQRQLKLMTLFDWIEQAAT
jgi:hypothetical protein